MLLAIVLAALLATPFTYFAFKNVGVAPNADFAETIPFLLFALFQLKFAIITPALITGSLQHACALEATFYI